MRFFSTFAPNCCRETFSFLNEDPKASIFSIVDNQFSVCYLHWSYGATDLIIIAALEKRPRAEPQVKQA